jgi:hypothetical protein
MTNQESSRKEKESNKMDTRKYKEQLGLRHEPARFTNRESAMRWSNNTVKMSMVMLGCDGKFWVVCPADATRLIKMGYEYAA